MNGVNGLFRSNGGSLVDTAGVPRPFLYITPIPQQNPGELNDGLGKLGVAPAPVMDQVGSFDVQALSNLGCAH